MQLTNSYKSFVNDLLLYCNDNMTEVTPILQSSKKIYILKGGTTQIEIDFVQNKNKQIQKNKKHIRYFVDICSKLN